MKKKLLIAFIPLYLLISFVAVDYIFGWLSAPSDKLVLLGIFGICVFILVGIILIRKIIRP